MRPRVAITLLFSAAAGSIGCSGDDSDASGDAGALDSGHDATTLSDAAPGTDDDAPVLVLDAGSDAGPPDAACAPLPGCSSPSACPEGNGCDVCTCTSQFWGCRMIACDGGSADASDGAPDAEPTEDSGLCPEGAPTGGATCDLRADVLCAYGTQCPIDTWSCVDGGWWMSPIVSICPPPGGSSMR